MAELRVERALAGTAPVRKTEELGRLLRSAGCPPKDLNRSWQGGPRKTWRGVVLSDVESARKR